MASIGMTIVLELTKDSIKFKLIEIFLILLILKTLVETAMPKVDNLQNTSFSNSAFLVLAT